MTAARDDLPDDIDALKRALLAERDRAARVAAELAVAQARASDDQALIAHQQLQIAKLTRALYGQHAERSVRLVDQMELAFEELESSATEDELAAERAAAKTTNVVAFTRKRPARQPFPEHLPRERVVEPGPQTCQCCGGTRLRKLGEDITETLEVIPRQWKVIQHVREKLTCRDCEKISQAPAPFHVIARGWAGPSLLAMILFEKYGQHQPLNRQSERYAREGVPLSLSTLADQVVANCLEQQLPIDAVKIALDVNIEHPIEPPAAPSGLLEGVDRRSAGAVSIGVIVEDGFQDGLQIPFVDSLCASVADRWNAQRPGPSITLGKVNPPHWRRKVAP